MAATSASTGSPSSPPVNSVSPWTVSCSGRPSAGSAVGERVAAVGADGERRDRAGVGQRGRQLVLARAGAERHGDRPRRHTASSAITNSGALGATTSTRCPANPSSPAATLRGRRAQLLEGQRPVTSDEGRTVRLRPQVAVHDAMLSIRPWTA